MKTPSSILTAMAFLAVASFGAPAVLADENIVSNSPDYEANHLVTSEPVADERTWVPFRALRSMDSPKQGPNDDAGKHPHHHLDSHHDPKQGDKADGNKHDAPPRALGQAHVTPAPTSTTTEATPAPTKTGGSHARATPAPTKINTPKATPASTTTRATPHPTTTTPKVASPPAAKQPKAPAAPTTKQGKAGISWTPNDVHVKSRSLGGVEGKQQLPHDCNHHHDTKPDAKNGLKHY